MNDATLLLQQLEKNVSEIKRQLQVPDKELLPLMPTVVTSAKSLNLCVEDGVLILRSKGRVLGKIPLETE